MYEVFNGNLGCVEYKIFARELLAEMTVWIERGYEVFVDNDNMRLTVVLM